MSSPPPLDLLSPFERRAFQLVRRMNHGRWQRFWFWGQRHLNARWIELAVGPLLQVHGLEHVATSSRERPLLLVANHRTFFDMYLVTSTLFRRLPGWRSIYFPVRGRYCYQSVAGLALNGLAAWWSMYPPFFLTPRHRRFDQWSLTHLTELCRHGPGRLVGFHPEGTRNKGSDPYSLLPAQQGIGRLIYDAQPQVVPVFIAGLSNSLGEILRRRWRGGESIRLWFGQPLNFGELLALPAARATYRRLADQTMASIGQLAEADRRRGP